MKKAAPPSTDEDPVMVKVRALYEASGLSYHELGIKMGYPEESARKSTFQFFKKTGDPRISVLRRFAQAMGVDVKELL